MEFQAAREEFEAAKEKQRQLKAWMDQCEKEYVPSSRLFEDYMDINRLFNHWLDGAFPLRKCLMPQSAEN
jgi:hypothetical protein